MNIISHKILKSGKKRVTVDIRIDESLTATRRGAFYKLGYPLENIIEADAIDCISEVFWCSIEQRWLEC